MPLPLTVSCFSKIQIGFTFLVPAHPGSPGQRAVKRVCVCVCVCRRPTVITPDALRQRIMRRLDAFSREPVDRALFMASPCSFSQGGGWVAGYTKLLNLRAVRGASTVSRDRQLETETGIWRIDSQAASRKLYSRIRRKSAEKIRLSRISANFYALSRQKFS